MRLLYISTASDLLASRGLQLVISKMKVNLFSIHALGFIVLLALRKNNTYMMIHI